MKGICAQYLLILIHYCLHYGMKKDSETFKLVNLWF